MTLLLSLFPGIDLWGRAFALEWPEACIVHGGDPIFGGDIREEHYPAGVFDGIFGGSPCQSFSSLAHLVRANGHEPTFGNLIPEFERVVSEAQPAWFVHENVLAAPEPVVSGYGTKSFLLDNAMLDSGDGHGEEQTRLRRFTFGMRSRSDVPDLRRWIDLATFLLPDAVGTTTQRTRSRTVTKLGPEHLANLAESTARTRRQAVTSTDGGERPSERRKSKAVSSSNGGCGNHPTEGRHTEGAGNNGKGRYRLADALRLQGLPPTFLDHCPFTAEGKLKAVANGVSMFSGRAVARAVKAAIQEGRTP